MKNLLHARSTYVVGAIILIGIAFISLLHVVKAPETDYVTATISVGDVVELVPVSGVVESNNTADLAFPVNDIVASVQVKEGDIVAQGQTLATLRQTSLLADRSNALALLEIAIANRDELVAGPRDEQRVITTSAVKTAEADLARTIAEENEKVTNAKRTLYSSSLEALPKRASNSDTSPTISGTYTCDEPGEYTFDVYSSSAASGYSYHLGGLGGNTYTVYTKSPTPFGTCGLSVQFTDGVSYAHSFWTVSIPNTRASAYPTNVNTYELAVQQKDSAVETAEEALELAQNNQTLKNASPRDEALRRANAEIQKAQAQLAAVNARIAERTLKAPFAGTITSVEIVQGETVSAGNVMTIIGDGTFELTARIPEIDIAKMVVGQNAEVVFDARANEVVPATISFISPLAIEIDGVAYFEAKVAFAESPTWLRSGLNADIDIIVKKAESVLRIPERFLTENNGIYSVITQEGNHTASTAVELGFVGNDGFAEIIGLNDGDTVLAP